jgi:tight adherence protein B
MTAPLTGGLLGAGVGLGLFMTAAGWRGLLDRPRRPRRNYPVDQLTLRVALAVVGLALAAWWTRWPALMISGAAVGWITPSLLGLRTQRRRQLARSEAVASWAEMLRDLLVSNAGLHEAIGKSARVAPVAIRDEVKALYVRTQRGELASALDRFAEEMDDGVADTVVTALQIADQRAVSDLGGMLTAVATSTRETVAMQLRINAARARIYRTAQLIAGTVAFFTGVLVLTNRDYLAPFGSAAGQVVLALVAGLLAVAVWGMVVLSRPVRAPRLLRAGAGTHREAGQ